MVHSKFKTLEEKLCFDDVLINQEFSDIESRKDVDVSVDLGKGVKLRVPFVSANMKTITGPKLAGVVSEYGGLAILHRFCSIEDNVNMWNDCSTHINVGCSIGVGEKEYERFLHLYDAGCKIFYIDVAHGAQIAMVDMINKVKIYGEDIYLIVGTFANPNGVNEVIRRLNRPSEKFMPDMWSVGVGSGSICSTRLKTGVGQPLLSSLLDIGTKIPTMSNGGIKNPGDAVKAIAAGAKLVMMGSNFAGTKEAAGTINYNPGGNPKYICTYHGSAFDSEPSGYKTSEGALFGQVEYKGSAKGTLKDLEGGLRSALTYVGAKDLKEFYENSTFSLCSTNSMIESSIHFSKGKRLD